MKTTIISLFLLFIGLQTNAQTWTDFIPKKSTVYYTKYAGILYNGESLWDGESMENPMTVDQIAGKLTVQPIDRQTNRPSSEERLGFMIGIRDYDTNTLWMLSQKVYTEIDLRDLQGKLDYGDVIVFMTVDRGYRLPRHEIRIGGGC